MNTSHSANAARQKMKIDILFSKLARMHMDKDCDAYEVEEAILNQCYRRLEDLVEKVEAGEV